MRFILARKGIANNKNYLDNVGLDKKVNVGADLVIFYSSKDCKTYFGNDRFFLYYGEDGVSFDLNMVEHLNDVHWKGRGILLSIDLTTFSFTVYNDIYGTYSAYYSSESDGVILSDSIRPFNKASFEPDYVSVLQFIKYAFVVGGYTLLKGVSKLEPNSKLTFHTEKFTVESKRNVWIPNNAISSLDAACNIADMLTNEVKDYPSTQLMFSAGWDSRTIFSALINQNKNFSCFSHGNTESRELKIADSICQDFNVDLTVKSLSGMSFGKSVFEEMLFRAESAMFPHWKYGGQLALNNQRVISGGTFGAILGGHNGPLKSFHGKKKYLTLSSQLLGLNKKGELEGKQAIEAVYELLKEKGAFKSWILSAKVNDVLSDVNVIGESNQRLRNVLSRYNEEGTSTFSSMYERFVSEHSGAQYMNRQLTNLECPHRNPFTNHELINYVSTIPFHIRTHNRLNRLVITKLAPALLNYPMAATLVNASKPMLVQEGSRAVRKVVERITLIDTIMNYFSKYPHKGLGWNDFEFLRNEQFLQEVNAMYQTDIFDTHNIYSYPLNYKDSSMYSFLDMICKSLTIDGNLTRIV